MELRVDGVLYVPQAEAPLGGTYVDALNLRMPEGCDAGANITVRDYLFELLDAVWDEGESFSGKRPFGNSDWEYDLYVPLVQAGFIEGKLDADGYIDELNFQPSVRAKAHKYVRELIKYAFYGENK
jgi:hypothetical protein